MARLPAAGHRVQRVHNSAGPHAERAGPRCDGLPSDPPAPSPGCEVIRLGCRPPARVRSGQLLRRRTRARRRLQPGRTRRLRRANAAAINAAGPADLLIANHLVLGGPVAAATGLPFLVKAHGSELEYAMRDDPGLCAWATESVRGSLGIVAGPSTSSGSSRSTWHRRRSASSHRGRHRPDATPGTRRALAGLLAESAADVTGGSAFRIRATPTAWRGSSLRTSAHGLCTWGKISARRRVSPLLDVLDHPAIIGVSLTGPGRTESTSGRSVHRAPAASPPALPVAADGCQRRPVGVPEAFGMVAARRQSAGVRRWSPTTADWRRSRRACGSTTRPVDTPASAAATRAALG